MKTAALVLALLAIVVFPALSQVDYNYLNGTLFKENDGPATPQVYLVLNGRKCLIPNLRTLNTLFGYPTIEINLDLMKIPDGDPLSDGAILARAYNQGDQEGDRLPSGRSFANIYLITHEKKIPVSRDAFKNYRFKNRVVGIPKVVLDGVETGSPLPLPVKVPNAFNHLDGSLLRKSSSPSDPAIYLIMGGKRCLVPNLETLFSLFDGTTVSVD